MTVPWVYRKNDLLTALDPNHSGGYCTTPSTDSSGTELFEARRQIAALQRYPRIARGTVAFRWSNAESGPANHLRVWGNVTMEHDPGTLALLAGPGKLNYSDTWSAAPLQMLQYWWDYILPEFYGVTCATTTPRFSDNAAANAATFSEKAKLTLTY